MYEKSDAIFFVAFALMMLLGLAISTAAHAEPKSRTKQLTCRSAAMGCPVNSVRQSV